MTHVVDVVALGEPLLEFGAQGDSARTADFRRGWGGDTSNFVIAAARLGASCAYVTRVGHDEFGRMFLDLWKDAGIDTSGVMVDPDAPTGIYFIVPDEGGEKRFFYYRRGSAASRIRPDDLDEEQIGRARVLHVSGISQAISEQALGTVAAAMDLARDRGVLVSYDANVRSQLQPLGLLRAIFEMSVARADIVFASSEDVQALYEDRNVEEVAEDVAQAGPRSVILKRGAAGSTIFGRGSEPLHVDAFSVDAVDPTGSGDAFAAGFIVAQLEGKDVAGAGLFASAVGALTATGLGAVGPVPTRDEVERLLADSDPEARRPDAAQG